MINEYYALINYRNRSLDWFSEPLEISFDVSGEMDHKKRSECEPFDPGFLYKKNDCYLETTNADEHSKRGFFTGTMGFVGIAFSSAFLFIASLPIIKMISNGFSFSDSLVAVFFIIIAIIAISLVSFLHLGKDWFSYRHAAIRFDRENRQVHVFYSKKLGGPRSYNWDDIIATVTDDDGDGFYVLNMTAVEPQRERFYDTFPIGGEIVKSDCLGWWEYIRRFMEEGPDSVPEPDWYLSDNVSLKESFLRWFPLREMKRDEARNMDVSHERRKMILTSPFLMLFSLGHFVSMLTSKRVIWSSEIRKACGEA